MALQYELAKAELLTSLTYSEDLNTVYRIILVTVHIVGAVDGFDCKATIPWEYPFKTKYSEDELTKMAYAYAEVWVADNFPDTK